VVLETVLATDQNYVEVAYLAANPDLAAALNRDAITSGRAHFERFGKHEGRMLRFLRASETLMATKARKLNLIQPLFMRVYFRSGHSHG
jgi:hypothetical protein